MAATLFCKRLVSGHNRCRFLCQATQIGVSHGLVEAQTQPTPDMRANDTWMTQVDDLKDFADRREEEYVKRYWEVNEPYPDVTLMIKRVYESDCVFLHMHVGGPRPPTVHVMNYNLKMLLNHKLKPQIARSFLAQMLTRGVIPDLETFSIVVQSYCKHLAYQQVHHLIFTQMKSLEVQADVSFYKTLMDGVCDRFGPYLGFELLKKLRSSHQLVQMPLSCYDAVVRQFRKIKKLDDWLLLLIDVLLDMKEQRIFPDDKFYCELLKVKCYDCEAFIKAIGVGKRMFSESIKTGAISPKPEGDMWKGTEDEEIWPFPRPMD